MKKPVAADGCKHENADHLMPGDVFLPKPFGQSAPDPVVVEQFRCLDCGAWLSLGRAKHKGKHAATIRVEIAAARLVAGEIAGFETDDDEANPLVRRVLDWSEATHGPARGDLVQVDVIYCDATEDVERRPVSTRDTGSDDGSPETAAALAVVRAWLTDANFHENVDAIGIRAVGIIGSGYDGVSQEHYVDVRVYVPQIDIESEIKRTFEETVTRTIDAEAAA